MADNNVFNLCERYFGSCNFYDVLEIPRNADKTQIKKAYYRLSLLMHPDRVEDNLKNVATEKFKILSIVHSILSDNEKRKIYDETGQYDDKEVILNNWFDYWSKLFKKITIEDIKTYENNYKGSSTELNDLKTAYLRSKGDMDYIFQTVPFTCYSDEPRLYAIIINLIEKGEIPEYRKFTKEDKKKKLRRKRKWQKENEEAKELLLEQKSQKTENVQDLSLTIHKKNLSRLSQENDFFNSLIHKYVESSKKQVKQKKSFIKSNKTD
ncbi:dnaJ homolog subfamily C member 9-like [Phymastichus coffea]|uniref:dnaJ homolog subfamily C member 9-like n=1 Tax=Phymastichus coffea TaxID=108790 RepID=UPI00273B48CD|nr:dnaJ homolog subfamily C member 9-like [Phymastichus coffea]XP_058789567.1 dnaJ homolog subfamily C member 9-like [Phymastichus coffea]XP_058789568.1 dnaJ homolog subfamily C member 9-like [Phymastichus coffea]